MNICHVVVMAVTMYNVFFFLLLLSTRRTCNDDLAMPFHVKFFFFFLNERSESKKERKKFKKKGYAFRVGIIFCTLCLVGGMENKSSSSNFKSIAINHQFLFNLCKYVKDIPTWVKFIMLLLLGLHRELKDFVSEWY